MTNEQRPDINTITTSAELRRWYWLKAELVAYCRAHNIPYSAGKFELVDRIAHYMDTGEIPKPKRKKAKSNFDWANATLTPETAITDNYKNNQNVRQFMTEQIGPHFRFNNDFMRWMRGNVGKTLADAVAQWQALEDRKDDDDFQVDIPHHNQFNQYVRDFFEDNPDLTMREARICWDYKRSLPSDTGRHTYASGDLAALEK